MLIYFSGHFSLSSREVSAVWHNAISNSKEDLHPTLGQRWGS